MFVAARRRGRPPKGQQRVRAQAKSIRFDPDLLGRIDAAAAAHKVGRSHEIIDRLEQSFWLDAEKAALDKEKQRFKAKFGHVANFAVCRMIAQFLKVMERDTGRDWRTDPWANRQFRDFIRLLLQRWEVPAVDMDGRDRMVRPLIERLPPALVDDYAQHIADEMFRELARVRQGEVSMRSGIKDDLGDLAYRDPDWEPPPDPDQQPAGDPRDAFDPIAPEPPSAPKKSSRRRK